MKYVLPILAVGLFAYAPLHAAHAQKVPPFIQKTYPKQAIQAAAAERREVMQNGALDSKTKYLIALGVAAQIPCRYCVYFDTRAAKHAGATDAQIKEAIAAAALVRKWSTVLNGSAYDFDQMRHEVDAAFASQ